MSQLSKQLQKLQSRPDHDAKLARSFLFSNADAKQISREQVHELATTGLRTLLAVDNRFATFLEPLFSISTVRRERAMLTPGVAKEVTGHIKHLCALLSPHLFTQAAQQVFEYLVRVYEVHSYDVRTVLQMFLPYHDHALFGRAAMLLDLRASEGFEFMTKNQLNGGVLPRPVLVTAAAENPRVMRLVCDAVADAVRHRSHNNAVFALLAGVAAGAAAHPENDGALRVLLPYLVDLIDSGDSIAAPAALLILCLWTTEGTLSTKAFSVIVRAIHGTFDQATYAVSVDERLATLGVLFRTQASAAYDLAATPTVELLLTLPWGDLLGAALAPAAQPLLRRLLDLAVISVQRQGASLTGASDAVAFVVAAARGGVSLSKSDVAVLFGTILAYAHSTGPAADTDVIRAFGDALRALERRHPVQFDAAVGAALTQPLTVGDVTIPRAVALQFVSQHVSGAKFSVIEAGGQALPLLTCIMHPVAALRQAAFEHLRAQSTAGTGLVHAALAEKDSTLALALHAIEAEVGGAAGAALQLAESLAKECGALPATDDAVLVATRVAEALWAFAARRSGPCDASVVAALQHLSKITPTTTAHFLLAAAVTGSVPAAQALQPLAPAKQHNAAQKALSSLWALGTDGTADASTADGGASSDDDDAPKRPKKKVGDAAKRGAPTVRPANVYVPLGRGVWSAVAPGLVAAIAAVAAAGATPSLATCEVLARSWLRRMSLRSAADAPALLAEAAALAALTIVADLLQGTCTEPAAWAAVAGATMPEDQPALRHAIAGGVLRGLQIALFVATSHYGGSLSDDAVARTLFALAVRFQQPLPAAALGYGAGVWALVTGAAVHVPEPQAVAAVRAMSVPSKAVRVYQDGSVDGGDAQTHAAAVLFGAIEDAVYGPPSASAPAPVSTAALCFMAMAPLFAPTTALRQRAAEKAQSTALTQAACLLNQALAADGRKLSATALSSLVEVMAPRAESNKRQGAALTEDMAKCLLDWLLAPSPVAAGSASVASSWALAVPAAAVAQTLSACFGERRTASKHTELVLGRLQPTLVALMARGRTAHIHEDEAALLAAAGQMIADSASLGPAALAVATALHKASTVRVAGPSGRFRLEPLFFPVLVHASKAKPGQPCIGLAPEVFVMEMLLPLHAKGGGAQTAAGVAVSAAEAVVGFLTLTAPGYAMLSDVIPAILEQRIGAPGNLSALTNLLEVIADAVLFLGDATAPLKGRLPGAEVSPRVLEAAVIGRLFAVASAVLASDLAPAQGMATKKNRAAAAAQESSAPSTADVAAAQLGLVRLLASLVQSAAASTGAIFDRRSDKNHNAVAKIIAADVEDSEDAEPALAFVMRVFTLESIAPLVMCQEATTASAVALPNAALQLVNAFTTAATTAGPSAFGGAAAATGAQQRLLRQSVLLVSALLPDGDAAGSHERLLTMLSSLVQIVTPVLGGAASRSALLHVPVLGLFLRLDDGSGPAAMTAAVDACASLVAAFPIAGQMSCLSGVAAALTDAEGHLQTLGGPDAPADMVASIGRLLKPGKIANRSEGLLNLIHAVLKSDAFLRPFVALQHAASVEKTGAEAAVLSEGCAALLATVLGLFAHYCQINAETEPTDLDDLQDVPEGKAYTMLLEVLAGTALGCLLAAIDEPAFVRCAKTMLALPEGPGAVLAPSAAAQVQKGLETLLDRLLQSLPTSEEQEGRATGGGLAVRPATTQISAELLPPLVSVLERTLDVKKVATRSTAVVAQYAAACVEEVVRICGGGGSSNAEEALGRPSHIGADGGAALTDGALNRLFGHKSHVQAVHAAMRLSCAFLGECAKASNRGDDGSDKVRIVAASVTSAVATVVRTLGIGFATQHSQHVLSVFASLMRAVMNPSASALLRSEGVILLRKALLHGLHHVLPATWLMIHPFTPTFVSFATHQSNASDASTFELGAQLLLTLRAVLGERTAIEGLCAAFTDASKSVAISPATHSLRLVFTFVERVVGEMAKEDIGGVPQLTGEKGTSIWLVALACIAAAEPLPAMEDLGALFGAYATFLMKFKEKTCIVLLGQLMQWAFARSDAGDSGAVAVQRHLLFWSLITHLLTKLGNILEFAFAMLAGPVVECLGGYQKTPFTKLSDTKGPHEPITAPTPVISRALTALLSAVRQMAECTTPVAATTEPTFFAKSEVFSAVMPALVAHLANTTVLDDADHAFSAQAEKTVIAACRAFFAALNSPRLWSQMQREILKYAHHPKAAVRRATLLLLQLIYRDGGDALCAVIMAEGLPAMVELTEDSDRTVVAQAKLLCNELSAISGQDVLHAMA